LVKVKICGITRPIDIEMARDADYLGFVVASKSRRNLDPEVAIDLMSTCKQKKVMVTTLDDPIQVVKLAERIEPDVIQVHNLMGPEDLRFVTRKFIGDVWGLSPVGRGDELERADRIRKCVSAIVLDTKLDPKSEIYGGLGISHDWEISRKVRDKLLPYPVILAGGLSTDNIKKAIRTVRPFAVDVSSGVEEEGLKEPVLVRRFIRFSKEVRD
jgi:phosphoribosylanthranilate isomerase